MGILFSYLFGYAFATIPENGWKWAILFTIVPFLLHMLLTMPFSRTVESPKFYLKSGDKVCVLMNSLGATPPEELYIMFRHAKKVLTGYGVTVARVHVGEFATSLEMAGASISIIRVDDELLGYINAPAHTPFFTQA